MTSGIIHSMTDESPSILTTTWARTADSISKIGYMDGASDGQKTTFQASFDTGFKQGFKFGLELGKKDALFNILIREKPVEMQLSDPRQINCQICLNNTTSQEDIVNLYNNQKEKNDEYLQNTIKANKR